MSLSGVLNMRHNRNLYRPCSAGCHPSLRLFAPHLRRISGHQADIRKRHIEFFCDNLGEPNIVSGIADRWDFPGSL
jgi:hypothetical protein